MFIDPFDPDGEKLCVATLNGAVELEFDEFIVKGVQGELYPCKPDIFEETYDKVESVE